jgi:hypothetical protein
MHSLSRSLILNDVKFDDQHSLKTICDHQISSENSLLIKFEIDLCFLIDGLYNIDLNGQ